MLIDNKKKLIYVLEFISMLIVGILLAVVVIFFTNPPSESLQTLDNLRSSHLEKIGNELKNYLKENETFLIEIPNCMDEDINIGDSESDLKLSDKIDAKNETGEFVHDPKKIESDTGYRICKSQDKSIIYLTAPLSDLVPQITYVVRI